MKSSTKEFLRVYFSALLLLPDIFKRSAFRKRTLEEELQQALVRGSLRKAFSGWDLLLLGLGIVIGSGWAQLSGFAAQEYAGPAVIISYIVSGLAALFAAACYAELCVEYPLSGGSFSYVMVTFGELAAFLTLAGLLLEFVLGMAAEGRSFSRYMARLCNLDPYFFRFTTGGHSFDFMAAGIILLMSVLLSLGVRESAFFISGVTVLKLVLLLFVSIVGYAQGSFSNVNPFLDPEYGVDGIFLGAAIILFSYIGFDAIGNTAEEVQNVAHLPWAIIGTVSVSACLYLMLALALVLMAFPSASFPDPQKFGSNLTFITAFVANNQKWMQYVVAIAALLGILTALTVGMFSVSRIIMVASRDWLLPPFLARVSPRTQTPLMAQMVFGVLMALLAMLVEVQLATALVSFGALVALWFVCNAQMYRRYFPDVQLCFTSFGTVESTPKVAVNSWMPGRRLPVYTRKVLVWVHLAAVNLASVALTAYYQVTAEVSQTFGPQDDDGEPGSLHIIYMAPSAPSPPPPQAHVSAAPPAGSHQGLGPLWFALAWALLTLSFQLCCPLEYEPKRWHVPWWLMPWLPSAAIGLVVFSIGSLPDSDYWKIGSYFGVALLVYLLFSLPMSYIKHSRVDYVNTEELNVVELAFVDGQWQPARLAPAHSMPWTATSSTSLEWKMSTRQNQSMTNGKSVNLTIHGSARGPAALPPTLEEM